MARAKSKKKKKVVRLEPETLKEPSRIPRSVEKNKVHVDVYLKAIEIPLWERGGRRAFAIKRGKEFATEEEFKKLFKSY